MTSKRTAISLGSACLLGVAVFSFQSGKTVHAADDPAKKQPVLVELFTSEGCSSCPPADALLSALDSQQSIPGATIIALSEHVDYWNSQGWHDPYSSAEITERQNRYATRFAQESSYTPEAVIDGAHGVTGSDTRAVVAAIVASAQEPKLEISISNASWDGKAVQADVKAGAHRKSDLFAVLADDRTESNVLRGENSGKRLEHVAVVRVMTKVGKVDDGFAGRIRVTLPGNEPRQKMRLVVFAQEHGTGKILGAAQVTL